MNVTPICHVFEICSLAIYFRNLSLLSSICLTSTYHLLRVGVFQKFGSPSLYLNSAILNFCLNFLTFSLRCEILSSERVTRNPAGFVLLYNLSIFIGKMLKRRTEMYLPFENYSEKLRECTMFPEVLRGMLRNFREQKKLQFSILMLIILLLAFARADKARESFNKILTRSRAVHLYD